MGHSCVRERPNEASRTPEGAAQAPERSVKRACSLTTDAKGSFSDQAGRVSSICVSTRVGIPGAGAGPGRGMLEGQVALVRPWAAFGRPRALERGHSGGSTYKVGFGRGRLLPTSVVLIDLY